MNSGPTLRDILDMIRALQELSSRPSGTHRRPQHATVDCEVIDTTYPARAITPGEQIATCDDGTTTTYEELADEESDVQ